MADSGQIKYFQCDYNVNQYNSSITLITYKTVDDDGFCVCVRSCVCVAIYACVCECQCISVYNFNAQALDFPLI